MAFTPICLTRTQVTYQCYKGGVAKGEGLETMGCPIYSHPAQLAENKDCVLCMTCLKACPHRSVELNIRPPAIELWTSHTPRAYEVALLFLLLNVVFLHRLPEISTRFGWDWNLEVFSVHGGIAIAVLFLPVLLPLLAHQGVKLIAKLNQLKCKSFIELAYGYLPLVLAGNLAHYLRLGLGEGGRILPVTLATFGLSDPGLPVLVAHPAVVAFLQGATLIFGVISGVILTQKIAKKPLRVMLPQHFVMLGLVVLMSEVIVGF